MYMLFGMSRFEWGQPVYKSDEFCRGEEVAQYTERAQPFA